MAELRKFLFDNFVIEEKRKNKPEAVEPEPEILPQSKCSRRKSLRKSRKT